MMWVTVAAAAAAAGRERGWYEGAKPMPALRDLHS